LQSRCRAGAEQVQSRCRAGAEQVQSRCRAGAGAEQVQSRVQRCRVQGGCRGFTQVGCRFMEVLKC
jgi:hypothetical protein